MVSLWSETAIYFLIVLPIIAFKIQFSFSHLCVAGAESCREGSPVAVSSAPAKLDAPVTPLAATSKLGQSTSGEFGYRLSH